MENDFSIGMMVKMSPGSSGPIFEHIHQIPYYEPTGISLEAFPDDDMITVRFPTMLDPTPFSFTCSTNVWAKIWIIFDNSASEIRVYCNDNQMHQQYFSKMEYDGYFGYYADYGWSLGCRETSTGAGYKCSEGSIACLGFFNTKLGAVERDDFFEICKHAPKYSPTGAMPAGVNYAEIQENLMLSLGSKCRSFSIDFLFLFAIFFRLPKWRLMGLFRAKLPCRCCNGFAWKFKFSCEYICKWRHPNWPCKFFLTLFFLIKFLENLQTQSENFQSETLFKIVAYSPFFAVSFIESQSMAMSESEFLFIQSNNYIGLSVIFNAYDDKIYVIYSDQSSNNWSTNDHYFSYALDYASYSFTNNVYYRAIITMVDNKLTVQLEESGSIQTIFMDLEITNFNQAVPISTRSLMFSASDFNNNDGVVHLLNHNYYRFDVDPQIQEPTTPIYEPINEPMHDENSIVAYWPFTDLETFRDFSGHSYMMDQYSGGESSVIGNVEGPNGGDSLAVRMASDGGLYSLNPNLFFLNQNFTIIMFVHFGNTIGPFFEHIVSHPDMSNNGFSLMANAPDMYFLGENMNPTGTNNVVDLNCNNNVWRRISMVYNQAEAKLNIYCGTSVLKSITGVDAMSYFAATQPDLGIAVGCRQIPSDPLCVDVSVSCLGIIAKPLTFQEMDTYGQICKYGESHLVFHLH